MYPPLSLSHTHTHTHTRARARVRAHTHTHTHTHTYTNTHTYTHTDTHKHTHTHTHTHSHTHFSFLKGGGGSILFTFEKDFIKLKYTHELDSLYCGFKFFIYFLLKLRLLLRGFHGWLDLTVVLVTVTDAVRTMVILPVGAKNIFIGHPFNVQPDVYIGEQDAPVREDVRCGYNYGSVGEHLFC